LKKNSRRILKKKIIDALFFLIGFLGDCEGWKKKGFNSTDFFSVDFFGFQPSGAPQARTIAGVSFFCHMGVFFRSPIFQAIMFFALCSTRRLWTNLCIIFMI
jgi:hypothetical protein